MGYPRPPSSLLGTAKWGSSTNTLVISLSRDVLQPRSALPFYPDHFCFHHTNTRKLWRSCKRDRLLPIDPWGRKICSWGFCGSFQAFFSSRVASNKRVSGLAHDVLKISSRASHALWWTQSADTLKRFSSKRSASGQVPPHDRREEPSTLFPLPISRASLAMTHSTSEEGCYRQHSFPPTQTTTPSYDGYPDKERDSIWSLSTVEADDADYPRPTRLYQCALVFAGFMATFQTIGANQTYGIFQASPSVGPLRRYLHMNGTLNRNTIRHQEARSLTVLASTHWPPSLVR